MKRFLKAATLASVIALSLNAGAQSDAPTPEDIKAAGKAFDQGRKHYKDGELVEAAEQFEAADQAAPSATALMLALRARKEAGQLDRAATLARLALDRHSDDEKLRKLAEETLAEAQGKFFELTVNCDEPCTLVLGTRLVHGKAAAKRVLYIKDGSYGVRAAWSKERVDTKNVKAAAGGSGELSFKAPPIPVEKPEPGPGELGGPVDDGGKGIGDKGTVKVEPSGMSPAVFWVGAGLTLVAGGVTVWSGLDTQNSPGRSKVKEECAGQDESCPLYQEGLDKQNRTNILAAVTGGVGLVTIVIGAFFTDWSGGETARTPSRVQKASIQPWLGVGNGATLGALGRF
ncbi:MAG: tetratricopeptide repeat protein [Polyangiaceae bacterium]